MAMSVSSRATLAERLHDRALVRFVDVDGQRLERLEHLPPSIWRLSTCGLPTRQLVALAAHVLDQDGQVQFATAEHAEHVGVGSFLDAQRDIALQLAEQTLAESDGW